MLTQNSTETARPVSTRAKLVKPSAQSPQTVFVDSSARALNLRYWLREVLLTDGQWVMYQAYDLLFNHECSVKMMNSSLKDKKSAERQLLHEADVLPALSHPNIADLYECSQDGNFFSVLEPLTGHDLHSLLVGGCQLPWARTLELLRGVGAALQHAHDRGFVHMDINPRSVFLHTPPGKDAAGEVVKVLNFGLARQLTADKKGAKRNLHLDRVFDAPAYLAPESLELSDKAVDDRADQWSLAVLAYRMLSGQLPFRSDDSWCLRALIRSAAEPEPLTELVPELPAHVSAAIAKALSKDKHQRFDRVSDFLRALDDLPIAAVADEAAVEDESAVAAVATTRPTQPELRIDLIARCRAVSDRFAATKTALPTKAKTREYPDPSFPAALLAAVDQEPSRLPVPRLTPPWTGGVVVPRRWGGGLQLWLVVCIMMALLPAGAALHLLHPVSRVKAMLHHRPLPAAVPPSAVAVEPSGPVAFALPVAATSALLALPAVTSTPSSTLPVSRAHKPANFHHGRTRAAKKPAAARPVQDASRNQGSASSAQEALAAGLGL